MGVGSERYRFEKRVFVRRDPLSYGPNVLGTQDLGDPLISDDGGFYGCVKCGFKMTDPGRLRVVIM